MYNFENEFIADEFFTKADEYESFKKMMEEIMNIEQVALENYFDLQNN